MIINLEPFFNADGERTDFNYGFNMDDEAFSGPVNVTGSIYNRTGIVNIEAEASFRYMTSCALCDKDLAYEQSIPVRHVLVSHSEIEDDDDLYIVVENMQFELDDLVSEDIYLAMPSRFLCKADCKGLCPMCGTDLNSGTCSCEKPTDPRWDVLKDLNL